MGKLKKILIGKPLKNDAIADEKYSVLWGLPILASDAVSSVAYASEEILLVLFPILGMMAFTKFSIIVACILGLLLLLVTSYTQTIKSYPNGGGAYIVAKENLGVIPGITAGAALSVDYVLTVAVSISSGTAAIIAAFPYLLNFGWAIRIYISLILLLILFVGNLRGLRESAKIFSIPTYLFIVGTVIMIIKGLFNVWFGGYVPTSIVMQQIDYTQEALKGGMILLMLKAFSSGCAALTGVEAVSNAIPNFRTPSIKRAQSTLWLLGLIVLITFGGSAYLVDLYRVSPDLTGTRTVLSLVAEQIFGKGFMYYYIQFTTAIVLTLAANTAYSGLPNLLSVMANDKYVPRQLAIRGDRLSYSNGIVMLTFLAGLLIVAFKGETHLLIPLYAVGVFMSFTLSQTGMLVKWIKGKNEKGRFLKALVNGLGALVTFAATIIIGVTKFTHGAWIVVLVIPILICICLLIKRHYTAIALQLNIEDDELPYIDICEESYKNHIIVPVASINKASIRALKYARTISENVVAFNVYINEEDAKRLQQRWSLLNTDIRLVTKYSPYRRIMEQLIRFVESEEHAYKKGDMITIIIPQFVTNSWWQVFLHNQTRIKLANRFLKLKHIVVSTMPLQLMDDKDAIEEIKEIKEN